MNDDRGPDEADLRASLRDGERFASVFERRVTEIHRYLSWRAGSDAADELTSEVFSIAFANRASYDPERATARAWLFGIAANVVRRHHRTARYQRQGTLRLAGERGVEPGPDEGLLPEDSRALVKAVEALNPKLRDVVLLVACADLTYAEAADALSIPIGTVRSRYSRARRQLAGAVEAPSSQALPGGTA